MDFKINYKKSSLFGALLIGSLCATLLGGCNIQSAPSNPSNEIWGQVDAESTDMISKIPGYMDAMYFKEGQLVKKGDILAHVSSSDLEAKQQQVEAQMTAAQAKANQARAAMELAGKDMERLKALYDEGAISAQMYDGVVTKYNVAAQQYDEAQAGIEAYQKGVKQVEVNVQDTYIKAPMDGVIATKYVNQGALVSTGMPIYNVQSTTDNWIDFKVPETIVSEFKLGQKVKVLGRDNKTELEGVITEISKKPDFATQRATSERGNAGDIISFNIKVQINDAKVYPGMRFKLLGYTMQGEK